MIYVPDKETVTARFGTSEMFILAITYDEETAAIAPIDEAPEHYILLNKAGIGEINLDRCFRVVFVDVRLPLRLRAYRRQAEADRPVLQGRIPHDLACALRPRLYDRSHDQA